MELSLEIIQYISGHKDETLELLKTLAKIPAPSNHEEKRADFCKQWLEKQGAQGVYIDDALNVVYPINVTADNNIAVFMAHTDVVFPDTEELPVVIEDGLIKAPGIGDDTANLVVLLMVTKYIIENNIKPKNGGILIVCNSGEEGLGNLKGSKKIVDTFSKRITEFFSFDGGITMICDDAVGSKRYKVEVLTEGGHSYGKFGNRNAIAYLASMIETLYQMKVPDLGKTTYNVGTISGGTSVNSIAQQAEMLYEFRSDKRKALEIMDNHFNAVIDCYRAKGITVNVELLGERPCSIDIDPKKHQELLDITTEIVKKYFNEQPVTVAGSTDCNIPLSMGIPSICVGTIIGDGAHTREEWVKIDSLEPGMKLAFDLMMRYFL